MVETSNVKVLLVVMQEVSSHARKVTTSGEKVVDISVLTPKSNEDIQGY